MQTVVETSEYLKDAKRARLSEEARRAIVDFVAENPEAGDQIPGTGGARKIRFAAKGKGKRGGMRVISFYSGEEMPVFLLNVFAKNEKLDLSAAERNELRQILGRIIEIYEGRN